MASKLRTFFSIAGRLSLLGMCVIELANAQPKRSSHIIQFGRPQASVHGDGILAQWEDLERSFFVEAYRSLPQATKMLSGLKLVELHYTIKGRPVGRRVSISRVVSKGGKDVTETLMALSFDEDEMLEDYKIHIHPKEWFHADAHPIGVGSPEENKFFHQLFFLSSKEGDPLATNVDVRGSSIRAPRGLLVSQIARPIFNLGMRGETEHTSQIVEIIERDYDRDGDLSFMGTKVLRFVGDPEDPPMVSSPVMRPVLQLLLSSEDKSELLMGIAPSQVLQMAKPCALLFRELRRLEGGAAIEDGLEDLGGDEG